MLSIVTCDDASEGPEPRVFSCCDERGAARRIVAATLFRSVPLLVGVLFAREVLLDGLDL